MRLLNPILCPLRVGLCVRPKGILVIVILGKDSISIEIYPEYNDG
jgi:hypothetical protein